jgi:hypothetical protein
MFGQAVEALLRHILLEALFGLLVESHVGFWCQGWPLLEA